MGLGSIASNPCRASAYADRMATRYLSCNCIYVFIQAAAGYDHNAVW
jgi:hypothetical protein